MPDLFEKFVAITLTNLLLSERGQPLRDGHDCKAQQMSLADSVRSTKGR
jgi:hypothetical protein